METGAITKHLGWGRNEIMGLPVRERRYWVDWIAEVHEMERKAREEAVAQARRESAWGRSR